ncbi:Selenoprotein O and cysteine-containing s [Rhodovulum sp. P5]|uniref:protein adenylyltransferase SelO n=1 Tax=Rhodovulum sp. P5 TaxID=1564506 RepID=UPI0009C21D54|nr:YdiU family protein [Rhodovulum sp. P5]ARE39666.1 Selenoprotein O and cysteine-containing s [Rhodovulum sp. P5]
MTLDIPFDNSYARLPDRFYARQSPAPVRAPALIQLNDRLAEELGLDPSALRSGTGIAMLAGNHVPEHAAPLAQAYAGHQFGGFVPQLGDGRAILLGEIIAQDGQRRDIQLKGAGRTPFSRMGDGRAWLGPVLREYIVSEAMHALGIPTTRALAAVTTGEDVYRQSRLPGAVLTRVAASHIRVGTFQYFAVRNDTKALEDLTAHVIARHYPEAQGALDLLRAVITAQARLVAQWMGVGFIHGVMNTDNMSVAGETIDYGPCAFMDGYHPDTVFSSIDAHGRYAFARQADIAAWNLAQLASCLLPLIDEDQDRAIGRATEALHAFPEIFKAAWLDVFRPKIGLTTREDGDAELIHRLLDMMAARRADFTNTFRGLADGTVQDALTGVAAFDDWSAAWQARLQREPNAPEDSSALMRSANPAVIPRNHRIEEAIEAGLTGDFGPFRRLLDILQTPFDDPAPQLAYRDPPAPGQEVMQTFCGT